MASVRICMVWKVIFNYSSLFLTKRCLSRNMSLQITIGFTLHVYGIGTDIWYIYIAPIQDPFLKNEETGAEFTCKHNIPIINSWFFIELPKFIKQIIWMKWVKVVGDQFLMDTIRFCSLLVHVLRYDECALFRCAIYKYIYLIYDQISRNF